MPRLSVIVPAYNAADTIASAIRSTVRALPRDAEVVVLDDGSTDGTADAARAVDDQRIRVLSRPNRGVAATLNDLLDATDSEFVARMDADDIVLPGRFRRQLRAMDSGVDGVFSTVVTWGSGVPGVPRPSGIAPEDFGMHLLLTNPVAHSTFLGRRSAVVDAGGYRELPTEDYDLWLRMAARGMRLQRLALPGLAYRVHPSQVTASADWRRSSWENPELAEAYSSLAQRLLGSPAVRITSLSIDDRRSADEKLAEVDRFAIDFDRAVESHSQSARRALRRKLAERRAWLAGRVHEDTRPGTTDAVPALSARRSSDGSAASSAATPRQAYRRAVTADRRANASYPKSRFVLRWFRRAQRWRAERGPVARLLFLLIGGSYKVVTEGFMGIELPVSTTVGPGLRLRHGVGVVVNPASRIGADVMIRQGVTLGNRKRADDCPTIEDGVEIGVGAVVIGAVTVGAGARIGPNAVVFKDVPAGAVVTSPASEMRF
ncbi:glycosyltransferase [Microbacterium sp. C5A9]|uniref:glycosyltransferase n=1 Tax=Microbacterium sp. C5A9 TaxID=2736663 RepID=UPI001F51D35D|nr:glycosyltransferase [Microbacterium sp. C5A9]MCI1017034.1 glycosyltransferase [Microbacterium sp. C5A9]